MQPLFLSPFLPPSSLSIDWLWGGESLALYEVGLVAFVLIRELKLYVIVGAPVSRCFNF
jgi:hypothetical protein